MLPGFSVKILCRSVPVLHDKTKRINRFPATGGDDQEAPPSSAFNPTSNFAYACP